MAKETEISNLDPASCRVAIAAGYAVERLERQKLRYGQERFDVELHARPGSDSIPSRPEARELATL